MKFTLKFKKYLVDRKKTKRTWIKCIPNLVLSSSNFCYFTCDYSAIFYSCLRWRRGSKYFSAYWKISRLTIIFVLKFYKFFLNIVYNNTIECNGIYSKFINILDYRIHISINVKAIFEILNYNLSTYFPIKYSYNMFGYSKFVFVGTFLFDDPLTYQQIISITIISTGEV